VIMCDNKDSHEEEFKKNSISHNVSGNNSLNLGWIGSSGILPSKKLEIQGVGGSSLLGLKTALLTSQEAHRVNKESQNIECKGIVSKSGCSVTAAVRASAMVTARDRIESKSRESKSNAGIQARIQKDLDAHKASLNKTMQCRLALERKAKLYDDLVHGRIEDDEERYEVDFSRKRNRDPGDEDWKNRRTKRSSGSDSDSDSSDDDESVRRLEANKRKGSPIKERRYNGELDTYHTAIYGTSGDMMSRDMLRARARDSEISQDIELGNSEKIWEIEARAEKERRARVKEAIQEVAAETKEAREKAAASKLAAAAATASKVANLKNDFLRKQLEALRGAKAAGTNAKSKK